MILTTAQQEFAFAIEHLKSELQTVRTGRASAAILDHVLLQAYGSTSNIKAVASISVPDPKTLAIQPWDKTLVSAIEKGIVEADIGVNPVNDGTTIRLNFPDLTEERRKELVKKVKDFGEKGKIAIRNIRHNMLADIKKEELPEDEERRMEAELQKLVEKYNLQVDEHVKQKEKELMTV